MGFEPKGDDMDKRSCKKCVAFHRCTIIKESRGKVNWLTMRHMKKGLPHYCKRYRE